MDNAREVAVCTNAQEVGTANYFEERLYWFATIALN